MFMCICFVFFLWSPDCWIHFIPDWLFFNFWIQQIVSVTLENYEVHQIFPENGKHGQYNQHQNPWGGGVHKKEDPVSSFQASLEKVSSLQNTNSVELFARV